MAMTETTADAFFDFEIKSGTSINKLIGDLKNLSREKGPADWHVNDDYKFKGFSFKEFDSIGTIIGNLERTADLDSRWRVEQDCKVRFYNYYK